MKLLTRSDFREKVFARDRHCAVTICSAAAEDAHHIIDRKCWPDGGYYLENGAALCSRHHRAAEDGTLTPQRLREWIGVPTVLPEGWDDTFDYDKWGNIVNWQGKYPHTLHLPWSQTVDTSDNFSPFMDELQASGPWVVTEKMDGENTTMSRDMIHARSLDSLAHPSQSYVRALWGRISYDVPLGMKVIGENVYATHSIAYNNLSDYFLVFAVMDGQTFLSWDETEEWTKLLGLTTVPVLKITDDWNQARLAWHHTHSSGDSEGYVVRSTGPIQLREWARKSAKYVRKNHVQTGNLHWRSRDDYGVNQLCR